MLIDLAAATLLLILGGLGMWTGAIRQVAHLLGLVVGFVFARPLGAVFGPPVARAFDYPAVVTSVGMSFVAFFLVYLAVYVTAYIVLDKLLPEGDGGEINRSAGLGLGLLKGLIFAYALLCALAIFERPFARLAPGLKPDLRRSLALGFARRHNLLAKVPGVDALRGLVRISEREARAEREKPQPGTQVEFAPPPELAAAERLAKDPRVRELLDDPELRAALRDGDEAALLSHPKVRALLEDPALLERLERL